MQMGLVQVQHQDKLGLGSLAFTDKHLKLLNHHEEVGEVHQVTVSLQ